MTPDDIKNKFKNDTINIIFPVRIQPITGSINLIDKFIHEDVIFYVECENQVFKYHPKYELFHHTYIINMPSETTQYNELGMLDIDYVLSSINEHVANSTNDIYVGKFTEHDTKAIWYDNYSKENITKLMDFKCPFILVDHTDIRHEHRTINQYTIYNISFPDGIPTIKIIEGKHFYNYFNDLSEIEIEGIKKLNVFDSI